MVEARKLYYQIMFTRILGENIINGFHNHDNNRNNKRVRWESMERNGYKNNNNNINNNNHHNKALCLWWLFAAVPLMNVNYFKWWLWHLKIMILTNHHTTTIITITKDPNTNSFINNLKEESDKKATRKQS